jgi:hypothetical protein
MRLLVWAAIKSSVFLFAERHKVRPEANFAAKRAQSLQRLSLTHQLKRLTNRLRYARPGFCLNGSDEVFRHLDRDFPHFAHTSNATSFDAGP